MQAFRAIQEVSEDGYVKIKVPSGMGKRVEVILLPAETGALVGCPGSSAAEMQNQSGFCLQILAAEEEDVWNDL